MSTIFKAAKEMSTTSKGTDWFERITGFVEGHYQWTQEQLRVEGDQLVSLKDDSRHHMGKFEMTSLAEFRALSPQTGSNQVQTKTVIGDARSLHADPANAGATFQVASQFNALEMVGPDITPERGVTRYALDRTQGPACAMATGAGTIWRNYLVPVGEQIGQTTEQQIDGLSTLGEALSEMLGIPVPDLWSMQNGYALGKLHGIKAVSQMLRTLDIERKDWLRSLLCVGWHQDVDVTDLPPTSRHQVNQVYCSALPVAYSGLPSHIWEPFARLVLEAAYEATLRAAWIKAENNGSPRVLLTGIGAGVFGNDPLWVADAITHALNQVQGSGLEVHLVGYREVPEHFKRFNC